MANRFLNNIKINDEYTLPSADGTADQVVTTDGAGQLNFVDQSTLSAGNAEHVVIYAKNISGSQIDKGTPVYITGTIGATDTVAIAPADAGNASHMPAVGLLDDTLLNNEFGYVITGGFMDNITTDPIDGDQPASNDTVYVKVGGGLTLDKPTGPTGLIQNIAKVGKVSGGNSGSLIVSSILRTNDVPNLTTGKIWVGDGNTTESTVVHLDETNGRMGIGTTSPGVKLHIGGSSGELFRLEDSSSTGNPFMSFYQNGTRRSFIQHVDSGDSLSLVSEYGGIKMMTGASGTEVNRFQINNAGRAMFARQGITDSMTASIYDVNITGDDFSDKYLNFWSQDGTNNPRAWLKHSSSASTQEIEFNSVFSTGSGYANFAFRRGTTPIMFLNQATQRVGIGTETPSFDLDVTGATGIRVSSPTDLPLRVLSTDATCGIELADSVHTYYMLTTGTDFRVRDVTGGNADRLTIQGTTGNVGIGNADPQTRLHVQSPSISAFTGTIEHQVRIEGDGTNNYFTGLGFAQTNGYDIAKIAMKRTGSGSYLYFGTSNNYGAGVTNEAMVIDHTGNVGIGTEAPSSKLQVDGGVQVANDADAASASKVGTLRYRTSGNNSYVDMCMQTGASTYAWVNIVQNTW